MNKFTLLNSFKDKNADYNINKNQRENEFATVMRALIWRYVSMKHREMENMGVTEDDINEVKSELSSMKYDFLEVLRKNGMEVPSDHRKNTSKNTFYYFINSNIKS
jgi:transient-receptor-potential-like protein